MSTALIGSNTGLGSPATRGTLPDFGGFDGSRVHLGEGGSVAVVSSSGIVDLSENDRCKPDELEYCKNLHQGGIVDSKDSPAAPAKQPKKPKRTGGPIGAAARYIQIPSDEELVEDFENSGGKRRFVLNVDVGDLPRVVNRSRTVARACCPKNVADLLFMLYTSSARYVLLCISFVSSVLSILGIIGVVPELGYAAVGLLPFFIVHVMHFNQDLLRSMFKCFDFWGLATLVIVSTAGLVDAVSTSPPRVFAIIISGLSPILLDASDARFPTKQKRYLETASAVLNVINTWTLVVMWNTGQFLDIQQRTVKIFHVTFDLQSFTMSCLTTFALLATRRMVIFLSADRESNVMVVIKPRAFYRMYDYRDQEQVIERFSKRFNPEDLARQLSVDGPLPRKIELGNTTVDTTMEDKA